jgi:short-subunit dehydrogenase
MPNKSALITGSSRGLGKSLALAFSRGGHDIVLHGRNPETLAAVSEEIRRNGVACSFVAGDLKSDETILKLAKVVVEKDIFILINNAAVNPNIPFENMELNDLESVLAINLVAPIKLTNQVYPIFARRGFGTIVNICSIDALQAKKGTEVYSAAKWGLRGFTDVLRLNAKMRGVRVIGVYLGGMKTDMYTHFGGDSTNCMDSNNVARTIHQLTETSSDMNVDNITINRQIY